MQCLLSTASSSGLVGKDKGLSKGLRRNVANARPSARRPSATSSDGMVRHARSRGGPVHIRLRARKGAGAAEVRRALVRMGAQPPWSSGWW